MLNFSSKNFLEYHCNNDIQEKINKSYFYNNNLDLQEFALKNSNLNREFRILQEISYKCNANCPYCMNKGLNYNVKELPVQDYINFYQKIIDQGGIIKLKITGGEPTQPGVIERTNELVKFAINNIKYFSSIQINTNGYWPIPIEWKSDKTLIQFSLDGDKDYMEKETGLNGIYENLIRNFDFCKQNNINFQFRFVLNENNQNFIPLLDKLTKKYDKKASITFVEPVGGAKNLSKEKIINSILNIENFRKNNKNKLIHVRGKAPYCVRQYETNAFKLLITPDGRIGTCAFMATNYLENDLTIFNLDISNVKKLQDNFLNKLKDRTCSFPNGFLNFWNSLTENEKKSLNFYINEQAMTNCPSPKDYYSLEDD